ncbi:MAG: universal stress protein, partial [Myxococcaceae bacterium]
MAAFRKIVVATDFSEAADEAVRRADELARLYEAELVVMHALPDPSSSVPMLPNRVQEWSIGSLALQRQVFEALSVRAAALTSRGPGELQVEIGSGIPYAVILEKAEELAADLVVVGGQGTGRRLGGVAGRVVRHAHCSVMVVRPK